MKKYSKLMMYAMSMAVVAGMFSCESDEAAPDIVTNPLDAEAYYIVGKVVENGKALADVNVSVSGTEAKSTTDGTFQLKVTKKGEYAVKFEKKGYITVSADATVATDVEKNGSIALAQDLSAVNPSVSVSPENGAVIREAKNEKVSLSIPAGAVSTQTDISVTEYTEGAKAQADGQMRSSLATINCEPDGLTFNKPVAVSLKNSIGGKLYFADIKHFVEKSGKWVEAGEASYDKSANAYVCELTGFSNHSVGVNATVKDNGTTLEALSSIEVDNLGKMASSEKEIKVVQKIGWVFDGELKQLIASKFPALSADEQASLQTTVTNSVASLKGSAPGTADAEVSMGTAKVSGDMKMVMDFSSRVNKSVVTFNVVYNGANTAIDVPVKTYAGLKSATTLQKGDTHSDHSGGAGK